MTDDELSEKKKRVRRRWEGLDPTRENVKGLDQELKAHEGNPKAQKSILKISSIDGSMMQSDVLRITGQQVTEGGRQGADTTNRKFKDWHPEFQRLADEYLARHPDRGKSAAARYVADKTGKKFNTIRQVITLPES